MKRTDHRSSIETPPKHGEEKKSLDSRLNSRRDEEYAAEFTTDAYKGEREGHEVISMYGWIGLALSVISFFMWPIVLGAAGIILGFVSRNKGAATLGNVAIAVGVISIIISLLMIPF
jgi:hypothetical protein